jgi:hypothetical protein
MFDQMHSAETVANVLGLAESGLGARRISAQTGLPVRTVTDWLAGRTPRGWRSAAPGCPSCGAGSHIISDAASYAYLLGLYLGDGYIAAHPKQVFRLRIALDSAYPGVVDSCVAAVSALLPGNKVRVFERQGCVEVRAYSKSLPCLLPQIGPGRKHEREIVLERWQRFYAEEYAAHLLRGLIHSDGCRFTNQGRDGWRAPRYAFSNRSANIRRIFCDACDVLALRWTAAPNVIYVSRKADVARMDEFIGPKQ